MNLSAGRRTILVGIDAPDWTRGFDPDVFALRVQQRRPTSLRTRLARPHAQHQPLRGVVADRWHRGCSSPRATR